MNGLIYGENVRGPMKILAALPLLLLSGCTTQPIVTNLARSIPAGQVIDSSFQVKNQNACSVKIRRDAGLHGSMCSLRVFIDETPVADLNTSEEFLFFVAPGNHTLSARLNGICGGGVAKLLIIAMPNGSLHFKAGGSYSAGTTLLPASN